MKKSKIIFGAVALTVGAMIVGRASSKFTTPSKLYFTNGGSCKKLVTGATAGIDSRLTTNTTVGQQFQIATASSNYNVYAATSAGSCIKPVHITTVL